MGHSVNTVNAQAGKFFNKIGDLIQGSMAGNINKKLCSLINWLKGYLHDDCILGDACNTCNKLNKFMRLCTNNPVLITESEVFMKKS